MQEIFYPRNEAQDLESENSREIKFSNSIGFAEVDGNLMIFKRKDLMISEEDVSTRGILSTGDKIDNFLIPKLLKGLPQQMHDLDREMTDERRVAVENLRSGKPQFISIETSEANEFFLKIIKKFGQDCVPGVIIVPQTKDVVNYISAFRDGGGGLKRLIGGDNKGNEFVKSLNLLVPTISSIEIDENESVYAVEFITDGEQPRKITREEMEDWLARVRESRIVFALDVGSNDPTLDNFIRKNNSLYWIDGDIVESHIAKDDIELSESIEKMRKILSNFLEK